MFLCWVSLSLRPHKLKALPPPPMMRAVWAGPTHSLPGLQQGEAHLELKPGGPDRDRRRNP